MEQQCSIFGKCGGCDIQHLSYEEQIRQKVGRIEQALKFNADIISPSEPYGYRNKLDCIIRNSKICMREKNSAFRYIELDTCLIASPIIQSLIEEMRAIIQTNKHLNWQSAVRVITFRATNAGDTGIYLEFTQGDDNIVKIIKLITQSISLPQSTSPTLPTSVTSSNTTSPTNSTTNAAVPHTASATAVLPPPPTIILTAKNIVYGICEEGKEYPDKLIAIKGNTYLEEKLNHKIYHFAINGFFQNNSNGAEKMLQYVYTLLRHNKDKSQNILPNTTQNATLIDLYGGVGTFGIYCTDLFKQTNIVEGVAPAIEFAKDNIKINNIKNATAFCLDAKQLDRIKIQGPTYCILDPPRVGMDIRAITNVRNLKPEKIIYISCNPQQLAKDIPKFKEYTLTSLGIFDMFAQTNHVEVIVELTKKTENSP